MGSPLTPFSILTFVLRTGSLSARKVTKVAGARPGPPVWEVVFGVAGATKPFEVSYRPAASNLQLVLCEPCSYAAQGHYLALAPSGAHISAWEKAFGKRFHCVQAVPFLYNEAAALLFLTQKGLALSGKLH